MAKNDFQYGRWNSYTLQCGTITTLISSGNCTLQCGSGIVTVNSPSGTTLQCDTWLWDDMPLNSPKRPPYWNSTSGFHTPQSTCHSVAYQSAKLYPNRTTLGRKKYDVMSIFNFKMAYLSHLGLWGSNNEKMAFLHFGVKIQDGGSPPSWILWVPWWVLWKAHVRLPII